MCELDVHSTGKNAFNSAICDCMTNYTFDLASGRCKETTNSTNNNQSTASSSSALAIGLGVGISVAVLIAVGIGVGVWQYKKREQERRMAVGAPYLMPITEQQQIGHSSLPVPGSINATGIVIPARHRQERSELPVCSICLS
jgi:hypothetical protein